MEKTLVKDFIEIMPLMHRKFFKYLRQHDFKKNTHVLMNISENDGQTMSFYCEALVISKPNFSKVVDDLLKEGYVERKQCDDDRRIYRIFLTDEGRAEVSRRIKIVFELVEEKLNQLNDDEKSSLHDHILGIHEILNKL